jgi:ATP-dependent Clp protease ATP-binding subunit ClpA
MFERFTDRARRVVFFARYEASQLGSDCVDTCHLMLALFREDRDLMRRCVGSNAELERIRQRLETQMPERRCVAASVDLPLSPEVTRALTCASEEAERMGHPRVIETGHILLGLLRETGSAAARILEEHGVDLATLREEIARSHVGAAESLHSPLADPHHLHWPPPAPSPAQPRYTREDLERLAREIPDERREAAARLCAALQQPVVSIAVALPGGSFSYSFRGPLGGAVPPDEEPRRS